MMNLPLLPILLLQAKRNLMMVLQMVMLLPDYCQIHLILFLFPEPSLDPMEADYLE